MKITVAVGRERHPVQVRAYPVEIEGFKDLYIHRYINRDGTIDDHKSRRYWAISEATTGLFAWQSPYPCTRQHAIEKGSNSLRNIGVEKFNKAVAESPKWLESEVTK